MVSLLTGLVAADAGSVNLLSAACCYTGTRWARPRMYLQMPWQPSSVRFFRARAVAKTPASGGAADEGLGFRVQGLVIVQYGMLLHRHTLGLTMHACTHL